MDLLRALRGKLGMANCSICGQYFKDPVILNCGFQCWKESLSELACALCQLQNFSQNQQLDNMRLLKQLRDQAEGDSKCCQQHQEHLELFCKNDQVFVCSVCRGSEEHQSHTVIPIETAALEFKDLFCSCLNALKKERDEILQLLEVMKAHFEELYQFLKEQESFLLSGMEEIEDNIAQKKEEHINQVSKELCPLEAVIWELQEKCQQPIKELLQNGINTKYRECVRDELVSPIHSLYLHLVQFFSFNVSED
uniref:B box-type domain-containing protein n=1 Tax=Pseudonaja textilis TaxID=8673 RepID=A0A670ZR30_PSETE